MTDKGSEDISSPVDRRMARLTDMFSDPFSTGRWPRRFAPRHAGVVLVSACTVLVMLLTSGQMSRLREALPPLSYAMGWLESQPVPMDMDHVVFFALVAASVRIVLPHVRWSRLVIGFAALAAGTELLQFFTVGRTPALLDARDDIIGAGIGLLIGSLPLWCAGLAAALQRLSAALLLAAVALLPWQQWVAARLLGFPLLASDLLLLLALGLRAFALASGRAPMRLSGFHGWLAAYIVAMGLAVILLLPAGGTAPAAGFGCAMPSPDYMGAIGKWVGIVWLAVVAALACDAATHDPMRRGLVVAWLAGAVIAALAAWLAVAGFYLADGSGWHASLLSHYGSLPPGPYPRVRGLFANANMAGLYLLLSLGLALAAYAAGWLGRRPLGALLALLLIPLLATASQAIGGAILLLSAGWFHASTASRAWRGAVLGLGGAIGLGVLALLLVNPAAPLVLPSVRMQLWHQSWLTWQDAFWRGNGLDQPAAGITYRAADGGLQYLTDAHNIVLNLGAQGGIVAVAAFLGVVAWSVWRTRGMAWLFGVRAAVLLAVGYLGIGGSFEDARVLWVALGLLAGWAIACASSVRPPASST